MKFLITVAWRNLTRNRRRTAITVSARVVAVAMCMASMAYSDGMYAEVFDLMVGRTLGHVQVHHRDYPAHALLYDTVPDAASVVERISALSDAKAVSARLIAYGLAGGKDTSAGVRVVGVQPDHERAVTQASDRMVEGYYLDDAKTDRPQAIIGARLARTLKLGVGDELVLMSQAADGSLANERYDVVGIFRTGQEAVDATRQW